MRCGLLVLVLNWISLLYLFIACLVYVGHFPIHRLSLSYFQWRSSLKFSFFVELG